MSRFNSLFRKSQYFVVPALILSWILWPRSSLESSSAFECTHIVMGILGLVAYYFDKRTNGTVSRKQNVLMIAFSCLFAIASFFGGLDMKRGSTLTALAAVMGAYFSAYSVMHLLLCFDKSKAKCLFAAHKLKFKPSKVFWASFCTVAAVDLFFLLVAYFPGNLSPDSVDQIRQALTGNYTNHHPFFHTIIIELFVKLGVNVFGSINLGVAFYHVFQILFMSSIFGFVVMTLYQAKAPLWIMTCTALWYVANPIIISYSFTMWKDILFAGAVLLFITALYRVFYSVGSSKRLNHVLVILSALGVCIWRSNGLYAFVLVAVLFAILFAKKQKLLAGGLAVVAVVGYVLTGPVLNSSGIAAPNIVENLSIPAQQIARVVYDGCELTESEYELLSNIMDVEQIPERYRSHISDPIKYLIKESGGDEYIANNKAEAIKLWISLGIKYPKQYISAWISQTKGYYYEGHFYWMVANGITENDYGLEVKSMVPIVKKIFNYICECVCEPFNMPIFNVFASLGLMFWMFAAALVLLLAKGRVKKAFVFILPIFVVLSLLVATPVYSEFRYAFSLCVSIPMLGIMLVREEKTEI